MKKIVIIGECTLDIVFPEDTSADTLTLRAFPGGRLLNAAAVLGDRHLGVTYVSECARDFTGSYIISFLGSHGVETRSIDRFTEGVTAVNLRHEGSAECICPRTYPQERFDVVWPRIDEGDIIVFGTGFALDGRVRSQMLDLLAHAAERKAIIIYVPGLPSMPGHSITRLMPDILENMEIANIIVTRESDLRPIFSLDSSAEAYARHIRFYCDTFINVNSDTHSIELFHRDDTYCASNPAIADTLSSNSGTLAALVEAMCVHGLTLSSLGSLSSGTAQSLTDAMASGAGEGKE